MNVPLADGLSCESPDIYRTCTHHESGGYHHGERQHLRDKADHSGASVGWRWLLKQFDLSPLPRLPNESRYSSLANRRMQGAAFKFSSRMWRPSSNQQHALIRLHHKFLISKLSTPTTPSIPGFHGLPGELVSFSRRCSRRLTQCAAAICGFAHRHRPPPSRQVAGKTESHTPRPCSCLCQSVLSC